jgi:hypothetical protein
VDIGPCEDTKGTPGGPIARGESRTGDKPVVTIRETSLLYVEEHGNTAFVKLARSLLNTGQQKGRTQT